MHECIKQREPIASQISSLVRSLLGVVIVSAAVILRLYALETKPFHHDEGVNGMFILGLLKPPYYVSLRSQ